MYYRRKLLLALLEIFDSNLKNTDCEKLLFNECKMARKHHYDFFPYRFGPFSFLSYYDKRRLTDLGLLRATSDFALNTKHSFFAELESVDQKSLLMLKESGLLGKRLIKKTYKENPQYTCRSEILDELFGKDEIRQFRQSWNTSTESTIFTLGYEGETIDSFIYKLIANNIMAIVDVRSNPQSMKHGFSKRSFSVYVEKAGIKYFHIPELGIPSAMRKGLDRSISRKQLFAKYKRFMLPKQQEAQSKLLQLITEYSRIALVCFEADYNACHRHTLVESLRKDELLKKPVVHL